MLTSRSAWNWPYQKFSFVAFALALGAGACEASTLAAAAETASCMFTVRSLEEVTI